MNAHRKDLPNPPTLCAAASAEITPPVGAQMSGYVARRQPSTGIHDPLYARALGVWCGTGRLLWLHADVIGFEREAVQRVKEALARRHGLAAHEVIVTATHTHSGPATLRLNRCGAYDPSAVATVFAAFDALADDALSRPEPVEVLCGEGESGLAIHRRPFGQPHTDPRLPVFGFRRPDGTFVAVLALYAMHNVAMGGENTELSADVAGAAARELSHTLPGRPPVFWLNGACGNLNPPSVGPDFARVAAWGASLAATARDALEAASPVEPFAIGAELETLTLALEPPVADEIPGIAEEQQRRAGPPSDAPEDWVGRACRAAADEWRIQMEAGDPARAAAPVDLHAIRLGPAVLLGVGAEVYSTLNDDLRADTGRSVYVAAYANGDAGYLCPEHACEEGGYEPDGAFIYYGTRPIPRAAYPRLRTAAARLIQRTGADE